MRLVKLTIGSAIDSPTHQFKNLKNVTIDFDKDHWVTVVIGWNGTGKSNVMEALAIIFRDLIAKKRTPVFAFQLSYRMGSGDNLYHIQINADPDREKNAFLIRVADAQQIKQSELIRSLLEFEDDADAPPLGDPIKLTAFLNADVKYLPRYIFSYYSGESPRMYEVFRSYLESYDSKLRKGEEPGLKRLFYAMPVHSHFVLLAFLIQRSDVVREFLYDHLGLDPDEGIESVLFVLRQPPWKSSASDGDPRFWNARGVVRDFLSRLYDIALAPIDINRQVSTSIWNKKKLQFKYLYVKDIAALQRLVGDQAPAQFFRDLESTHVSELIEEVRIRVRLKKNDGGVTFRELSEGEQQLLTVLGLLRFTAEDESLFLLDEPDTHLNPRWSVDYISYLKKFIAHGSRQEETSHVLLTTHNPLAIAELDKEQVQILTRVDRSNNTVATQPVFNPRGMGFAGLLTSDLFQLSSSLDRVTQEALEVDAILSRRENLTESETKELDRARKVLQEGEFRHAFIDPLMEEYSRARSELIESGSKCSKNLSEYPGSPLRRRIAKKILIKTLGLPQSLGNGDKK
ncbi:AAA family ATPase [Pseudomonas canadensis]|uniref:AAA family ATPase n=1 Tax=Pseudomonas canadensis TaxID=915099 RepID=UPI002B24BEC9|nr:AAA family ATPase [Pseudomonas canadensis]MEB2647330.1 AAA family ATPase [Pseudomonas canadensis]